MASFDMNDAWMARPDSDDLVAHPLFGAGAALGQASNGGAHGFFADVTHNAHNQYNTHQHFGSGDSDCAGGEVHSRAASGLLDEDDAAVARGPSSGTSLGALPPSQQYTEAASSEAFSQGDGSGASLNPATVRTDEFLSFWSHKGPRANVPAPPTPVMQRTAPAPEESPGALVDGIVRAGLDTPNRHQQHAFSRPMPAGFSPDNASTYSGHSSAGAHTASTSHQMPRDPDSPNSSSGSHSHAGSGNAFGVSPINQHQQQQRPVHYRTVQQHLQLQQQQQQQQMSHDVPSSRHGATRPSVPPMAPGMGRDVGPIIVLEFKMDRRRRFRCPRPDVARAITPDQWVVVQLDNGGVDMGTCVEVYTANDRLSIPKHYGHGECGSVLRLANEDDCRVINDVIPEKEENALAKAHQLVHFLHMPFTCIDAEFQFDLKVVNLYYTLTPQAYTSVIPNVSRLQRELGFLLKAKVHLEQLVPVAE
eukprot:CAMPEP_0174854576 /NCGR_PEP_ID=MMETSP1114-20130205/31710_1 /TAXON_ID=312471 /ORGANISM="Neobodo designis, Strain CCAP 1951/1" /LENGTH=475 /DNA_ID=CAMNT_0016089277 /DNA_START=132 /DNA_END=1559 /DNA_ORIENTATION=+